MPRCATGARGLGWKDLVSLRQEEEEAETDSQTCPSRQEAAGSFSCASLPLANSCHYKSLHRVRANNTMSTLDGAAGSVSQGSICLLDALLLLIAFASHVAQTSIWMSGMKKINAYYIKYVIKGRP